MRFEGNHHLSDDDLIDGLALHRTEKAGRPPDPYLVQLDADRLRGRYARDGYFATDVQSRVERQRDAATVTYTIQEGARASTHVEITGLPPDVPVARVRAVLPLADGAPFVYDVYDQSKVAAARRRPGRRLRARQARRVRSRAISRRAPRPSHLAFTPGPKCTFGKVEIQGVERRPRATRSASACSSTPATRTRRRRSRRPSATVYGLNRFSTVQVEPQSATDDRAVVDMKVAVVPSAAHQVTLGGGFGVGPDQLRGPRASRLLDHRLADADGQPRRSTCGRRTRTCATAAATSLACAPTRSRRATTFFARTPRARSRSATTTSRTRRSRSTARARCSATRCGSGRRS